MSDAQAPLAQKNCLPCEQGGDPLPDEQARAMKSQLHADWQLIEAGKKLERSFKLKDFYETMSFVNAVAHVANRENHHPDLAVSYNRCVVTWWTHAVGGLSENDFICAAKVDALAE